MSLLRELRAAEVLRGVVLIVAIVHAVWGLTLLAWPSSAGATALWLVAHQSPRLAGFALVVASLAALASFRMLGRWRMITLGPQQFLSLISAGDSLRAVWLGQYADGTVIPRPHIFADQLAWVVLGGLHAIAFAVYHRR